MKTKFLIIISVLVLIPIQLVYAPPPESIPEDDFRYSDHVITGKIISSEIIKDPREDNSAETFYDIIIYQVKVEEWHKNPLENDIITVYGTHYPNDVIPEPDWGVVEFEIGDTVYLYINETDDGLEFRKYASKLLQKYIAEESKGYLPPLKQIKSGVSIDEIQCKQNLTLVIKQNGSPACVKPETKTKLIERGWAVSEPEAEPESILMKAASLGINNIMEAGDSEELSYDEKVEYIKFRYEEDGPVTTPSLNIRIRDLTRNLEYGQLPTFTLIEAGYANPCTSPKLEVYFIKEETGHDLKNDELIYEHQIVYSCPPFEKYYPVLKYWSEQDFPSFPACIDEGRYLIVGDSGTERIALEEYYCNPK